MDINLNTPSLLFPAITLLMLAYTNRYLGLATTIRNLHKDYLVDRSELHLAQIHNMRVRIRLIRNMQICGVLSLLLCMVCMFFLFAGWIFAGKVVFVISLLLMIISLGISLVEIQKSIGALDILLGDIRCSDDSSEN